MRGRTTDFWVVGAAFFVSGSQLLSMLVAPLSFAVATDIDAEPKDSGATMEFDVEIVVVSALVDGVADSGLVGLATALTADAAAMLAVPHKPFNRGNRAVDADVPDPEVSALVEVAVAEDAVGVARAEALSTSFCKRGNREAVFAFVVVVGVEELVPVAAEVSVAIIDEEDDDNDDDVVPIALCVVVATAVVAVVATVVASSTNFWRRGNRLADGFTCLDNIQYVHWS
jgi:hypothetical protein